MELSEELAAVAAAAAGHGDVAGVLAAEATAGQRTYLVAYEENGVRSWLVLDEAGEVVTTREVVRDVASIVVMCELAADVAGGGNVDQLRSRLAQLRVTEAPPGIEEAEEAALALERELGAPPRLASPRYLDAVGEATRRLEQTLGDGGSAFASALQSSTGAVGEFVREVEGAYRVPLR